MKRFDFQNYRASLMLQDTLIVLMPAILALIGILWFFRKDWIPMQLTHLLASFLSLY